MIILIHYVSGLLLDQFIDYQGGQRKVEIFETI